MREKNKKGFTLLEVLIATFLLVLVGIATFGSLAYSAFFQSRVKEKFIASYLAQEAVEILKNFRDSNIVAGKNWKEGLLPGQWEVDYKSNILSPFNNRNLKYDPNLGYTYQSGTDTFFKRKIILSQESENELKVEVTVYAKDKEVFKLTSALTNW